MKALRIEHVGHAALCDLEAMPFGAGDLRIRVSHVGLCGSDLSSFRGLNPLTRLPRVPGHEAAGTVIETGADVPEALAPGQSVIIWPYTACGACSSCRAGRPNACRFNETLGVQRDGTLREEIVLPATDVIRNDSLPPRLQVLVEPLSVGFHAAGRARVGAGQAVLVLGCGMIGLGAIMAAARAGARVIAVDINPSKEAIARLAGAWAFCSGSGKDLEGDVMSLTAGQGADIVIEAVGATQTFLAAIDLCCYAGRVVNVGYCQAPVPYDTKVFNLKELDIYGSRNSTRADFCAVISVLEGLGSDADRLISHTFRMEEAHLALGYWDSNRDDVLKIVVSL